MPRSDCSALHGVNPNLKKIKKLAEYLEKYIFLKIADTNSVFADTTIFDYTTFASAFFRQHEII